MNKDIENKVESQVIVDRSIYPDILIAQDTTHDNFKVHLKTTIEDREGENYIVKVRAEANKPEIALLHAAEIMVKNIEEIRS